jgi:AcrR family transcriptional regulator
VRSYHHGDLRAQLLARAADLVARDGAEAFSLRAVAAELGVSHTAPRHHFGDRQGVFTALATEGYTLLGEALEAAAPLGFREVGAAYVLFAVGHPGHFAVMHAPDLVHPDDPGLTVAAARTNRQLIDGVAAAAPGSREQLAVRAAAAWALVHGLATLALSGALAHDHLVGSGAGDLHGLVLDALSLLDLTRD